MSIRCIIAERIQAESERRGLDYRTLAELAGLDLSIIQGYIRAERQLVLVEIKSICDAFGINTLSFLSANYTVPAVRYRLERKACRKIVQKIENALQIIIDYLHSPEESFVKRPDIEFNDRNILLAMAAKMADAVKKEYGNKIEEVYEKLNLPIVSCSNDSFEAFLFASGQKYVVCCSNVKSEVRIHFSLAHELCHYLFDKNVMNDVDECISFYSDTIPLGAEREFFATKFAQFFLIPFSRSEKWAIRWPYIDHNDLAQALVEGRCSVEVAINSIYDQLGLRKQFRHSYNAIKYALQELDKIPPFSGIRNFLWQQELLLREILDDRSEDFSPDILTELRQTLLSGKMSPCQLF